MTTDNHLESKSLIKHIKFQIHKDKICNLAKTHKKNIAYFLAAVVVAIIILVGNSSYQQFQAKKYSTRTDFQKGSIGAYVFARKNNLLDECCKHMKEGRRPNGYWSLERCKEDARNYSSKQLWRKESSSAYVTAKTKGWLNECCKHMLGSI